jgi:alanine racemase
MVDLTEVPGVACGDEVILMGESGDQRITAGDLGSLAQTISYEMLCTIGKLVPRIYRDKTGTETA